MKLGVIFVAIFGSLALTSCSVTRDGDFVSYRYGRFCGLDHPAGVTTVSDLVVIEPKDDFDLLCMHHDICYMKTGMLNRRCDVELVAALTNLEITEKKCDNARLLIVYYFLYAVGWQKSVNDFDTAVSVLNSLKHTIVGLVELPFAAPGLAIAYASQPPDDFPCNDARAPRAVAARIYKEQPGRDDLSVFGEASSLRQYAGTRVSVLEDRYCQRSASRIEFDGASVKLMGGTSDAGIAYRGAIDHPSWMAISSREFVERPYRQPTQVKPQSGAIFASKSGITFVEYMASDGLWRATPYMPCRPRPRK